MKCSHWTLKPLSYGCVSGISCHCSKKFIVCFRSGFHTGRGVATRGWARHDDRPATAEPSVPSTWKVARSSRRTRVAQLMLIWAITGSPWWPVSWQVAEAGSSAVGGEGRGGVAGGGGVGAGGFVPAPGNMRGTDARHRLHCAKQVVEHIAPVAHHVQDHPAAVF